MWGTRKWGQRLGFNTIIGKVLLSDFCEIVQKRKKKYKDSFHTYKCQILYKVAMRWFRNSSAQGYKAACWHCINKMSGVMAQRCCFHTIINPLYGLSSSRNTHTNPSPIPCRFILLHPFHLEVFNSSPWRHLEQLQWALVNKHIKNT